MAKSKLQEVSNLLTTVNEHLGETYDGTTPSEV